MHPQRVGRRWKNSRSKRRRGLVVQETSTVPSSSTESTTNGMHTPTERVVAVEVEKVSARFACLDVEGEETTKRFTPATAVSLSPRTRQKGTLRSHALFPTPSSAHSAQMARSLPPWNASEHLAFITFILLYTDGTKWPSRRCDNAFWENAAKFIQNFSQVVHLRTSNTFMC